MLLRHVGQYEIWDLAVEVLHRKVINDPGSSSFQEMLGPKSHRSRFCSRMKQRNRVEAEGIGKKDSVTYHPNQDTAMEEGTIYYYVYVSKLY